MSNILRPNFFGIGTSSTPEWVISSGMVAKVTDASGDQIVVMAQGGKLDIDGALGANLIVLQGLASSQVSVYRSGTEARFKLLSTGETFLSLPSTSTVQTLRFTDGDKTLQIVSGSPRFAGTNISTETAAPALTSAGVVGSELRLVFNEEMSGGNLPLASAFQIAVNGTVLTSTEYTLASAEGDTVRINLPASAATAATVSVGYTDPTTGNDTRALQDINGNDVASFGPLTAVRNPVDVRAPILIAAATSTDGGKITLEFNEELAAGSLAVDRFAVTVAGTSVGVNSVSVQNNFVELSLSAGSIAAGQAVQLAYSGAAGSADAARDAAGNAVASWTAWNVSNDVLGTAPVLAKASNILKPNLYGIETPQTPNWKVSAGMVAKVTDASGNQVITVARGGKLDLDGAVGSNVIVLEGRSSTEVEVYRSGTEVRFRLLESGETILSMPATSTAQTVRFANGDKILQIVSGAPRFDGVAVSTDLTAPVCERATISGTELRLVFSEELHGSKLPAASALTITVNGQVLTASQFTIQGVEARQLVVALTQAVAEGAVVTVAYADPTTANDDLALQDINGNDAASFGPIQAVEPIKKVILDDQVPAGGPGNPVSLTVSSQAFHLVEDFARTSNFEVVGFGADDKIELTNLQTPAALSISTIESDVEVIVNAGEGVTSALLLKGVVPHGVTVYNPATFNDLAVGDIIGIDASRPVFTGGASRVVSVVEGQAQLVTATATDASAVTYTLDGTDAALLQVSAAGVVSLKSGVLDYDAVGAKRTYSFDVVAIDAFGNDRIQAVTVNVTNDTADDGTPTPSVTIQTLAAPDLVAEGSSITYAVTLSAAAPAGGFVVDWRVVAGSTGDPAEAQDFGTGASSVLPSGSITVAAGQTTGQIVVPVFDDTLSESAETFLMQAGRLMSGTFTVDASRGTSISASDSGGATPDDFCELDPATEYAAYVAAEGTASTLPTGMTRHVSTPVQKDGSIGSVASYGTAYAVTVDAFISAVSGLSTTATTFGYVLETFETRAAGNFAGTGTGYTAAAGTSITGQSGGLSAGDASGTLVIDGRMDIKLFNIGSSFTGGGDLPGNDPGVANNTGNDADRGYNQTEGGNLYLEVLPADQRAGGVLVCFDELGSAVYGFGFHLMGREADKRDVYLDVHLSDGTIYRELTGANPNGTGGEQFYSFTIAPSGGKTIEGFVLYESWVASDNADRRDIFAIDDLALVVADKAGALTSTEYREEILGRNSGGGGGADTTPPVLTISSYSTKVLAGYYGGLQFQFSEPVTGFDVSDVVVTGGTLQSFSGSGSNYSATFLPTPGIDGQATFTVAAGAYTDAAGNAGTAAATLSVPTFTVQPGNSGRTEFNGNQITVSFSEAITATDASGTPLAAGVPASASGFYLTLNPSASNDFFGVSEPSISSVVLDATGKVLTLTADTSFSSTDVVRLEIYSGSAQFRDADGNRLAQQEIYIGGSGNNTIDLEDYGDGSTRQILRGNGGNDTLIGTDYADSFVDGGGIDFIDPVFGGDSISLVENGQTGTGGIAYARDTITIGLGDSRRGVGNTDVFRFDPANANSGFDWFSPTASTHDVLKLESGVIGSNSSFLAAPAAQGAITSHGIVAGIVTFRNSAGADVAITQATNLGNALDYLRFNLQAPGHTVAFKADYDNNGTAESLFVYQDTGTVPLVGNAEMPDIVVRIEQPGTTAAGRLAAVTLGNTEGANVLQIVDGFSPEPMAVGLTSTGVALNFAEPVFAPSTVGNLAMTLQVNGAGTVYTPASVTGSGTAVLTVQAAGLALGATDWALVSYGGSDASNALRDAAGNLLLAEDDEGNAGTHTFALGSGANNTINLAAVPLNGRGLGIEAQGGHDHLTGTALADRIWAGTGADTITGGGGGDRLYFEQGDSPVPAIDLSGLAQSSLMLEGARYTFSGGVEIVNDLSAGDEIVIAPLFEGLLNNSGRLTGVSISQTSQTGSMTGPTGQVPDQRFMALAGTLGDDGVFTVGSSAFSLHTLVLYDGDNNIGSSQTTGFVLKDVKLNDLEGLYGAGSLRLRAPYTINGTPGNDTLYGTESADIINGLAGDDQLEGRGGNDSLSGGEGNDYLIGGNGNDTLDGGSQGSTGSDIAAYWLGGYTSPVNFTSTWRTSGGLQADGTGGTDTLTNIEELHFGGGSANDVLMGDSGRNYIQGEGGDDSITGGGGNDTFAYSFGQYHGPQGNDTVIDFTGDDQLWFNNFSITSLTVGAPTGMLMVGGVSVVVGTDRTVLHVGADTVPGADLTITLLGGFQGTGFRSNLVNYGGATNSEIRYAAGQVYTGTSGNDSYNGGEGNDTLSGADGNDSLSGFGGDDALNGQAGNDQLRGDDGNDTLEGGDGNDYMTGGPGNDSLVGGAGTDTADYYFQGNPTGSLGPVTVDLTAGSASGAQGNDTLSGIENVNGTDGNDLIRGDGVNNSLEGRDGNDTLRGEAGDDYFTGGLGADLLEGGGGFDTANYSDAGSAVQVELALGTAQGGGGSDTLVSIELAFGSPYGDLLKGGNPTNGSGATDGFEGFRGNAGNDTIDGGAGFDRAQYDNSPYAVQVTLGGSSPGSARDGWRSNTSDPASDGTDTLINIEEVRGSAHNDTLTGSEETGRYESFEGRAGNDTINGRGGTDRASYQTSPNAVSVNLGLGTARDGWRSNSSDPASDGTDTLTGIEEVRGSDHNDTIVGSDGNNWLEGRSGNDSLAGGAGTDTLFGEAGSDTLDGGDGDDFVTYRSSTAGIVVDLTKSTGQVQDGLGGLNPGVDTVIGIEGFIGSSHGDQFLGPVVAMPYLYIEGAGGADTIDGGTAAGVREVGFTFETTGVTARLSGWVGSTGALPTGYTGSALDGSGAIDVLRNIQNLEGSNHNDALYGDANDNNIDGRGGADTIDGGDGRDTIEFNQAKAGIHVDLSQNLVLDDGQGLGSAAADAAVEQDTLVSIENVDGGGFNDLIVGNGVGNFLQGQGGIDTLNGGGGDDTLQGGSGDDTLDGGAGVDTAAFTGAFADYTVLIEAAGIRITDTVANRDGIDQVMNVERFLFSDGEYRVSGSGAGLAALNPQAAEVLDLTQGSGYTDAVDASTFQFTDSNIGDWIDGFPPLLISQVTTRTLATIVGESDDNEFKYGMEFTGGTTQVFFRYDTNAAVGQVQPSDLIELSFPGDVRASLVPESLTYSG